jgi:hypothetical protein
MSVDLREKENQFALVVEGIINDEIIWKLL